MSRNKIVLIIICIFVISVLILGITLGIILGVRNRNAALSYEGVRIGVGECAFLASVCKSEFLNAYAAEGAEDTSSFWNSKHEGGDTYAALLRTGTENYIKEILIKNYLFERFCTLDDMDEISVKRAVKEILEFRAGGSEEKFNEIYKDYGFDFEDLRSASYLLYKAGCVADRIYGEGGANMQSFTEECDEFFEGYSHVKLLFIRTENKFLLDEDGNRVINENGEDTLVALTSDEMAQRQQLISEIRESIQAYEDKTDGLRMTPEYFNLLLTEHGEGDPNRNSDGYYFSEASSFTLDFISNEDGTVDSDRSAIVKSSLSMEENGYAELSYSGGVCFIYKYANKDRAYTDTDEGGFFSDFYSLASEAAFSDALEELIPMVKVNDKFSRIDPISVPYREIFTPKF